MRLPMTSLSMLALHRTNVKSLGIYLAFTPVLTPSDNVGQQLLSCGIVLLEIPSNLILYKLGPRAWIGCQMFGWGLVSLFQSFQKGLGAFLATRLLLGLCESGFIPAGLYTITMWYKREESSARFAWFFIGNMSAAATTGLIAYGVLQMRGIAGLTGWQWLFIVSGPNKGTNYCN